MSESTASGVKKKKKGGTRWRKGLKKGESSGIKMKIKVEGEEEGAGNQ